MQKFLSLSQVFGFTQFDPPRSEHNRYRTMSAQISKIL